MWTESRDLPARDGRNHGMTPELLARMDVRQVHFHDRQLDRGDGVAIAAGFMIGPALGTVLFMAVLLHKVPEGFTIASIMLAGGQSRRAAVGAGALLGVLTLTGAAATTFLAAQHVAYALALSAGVTIYVAASDLIPEVNREGGPALGWTVFAGLVLFALADWLVSPLGGH